MAWLHSAPKRQKNNNDEILRSRLDTLDDGHPAKCLPEIDSFLSLCFQLSGMVLNGSMGVVPLTWSELESFSAQSAYVLTGWESEQVINMSRAYCSMSSKAKDLHCPPPYMEGISEEDALQVIRDKVARQWASFSSDVKPKKGA